MGDVMELIAWAALPFCILSESLSFWFAGATVIPRALVADLARSTYFRHGVRALLGRSAVHPAHHSTLWDGDVIGRIGGHYG